MTEKIGESEEGFPSSPEGLEHIDTFTHEGLTFSVYKEALKDGRVHLYFAESSAQLKKIDRLGRNIVRIGYRVHDGKGLFLGLMVPESIAGRHMGTALIDYFLAHLKKEGLTFVGTGQINKPLIAQTLVRSGFVPESRDVLVEILPHKVGNSSRVPDVQLLENRQNTKLITRSPGGRFYRIIPPGEVHKYPISGPDSIVAIQTRYDLAKRAK